MGEFDVKCEMARFPNWLARETILRFTEADLARALFVTGRAPGDVAKHGLSSWWEFVHRVSMALAYLRRTSTSKLTRSQLAVELDRSEKVSLSYSLGQAMAGIFCSNVLGVKHVLHLDRYGQRFGVTFNSRLRPDLIGYGQISPTATHSEWVVVEAKGRSNAMESSLRWKLIEQKKSVRSINGKAPALAVGTVAAFPAPSRVMKVHAVDPDEPAEESIDMDIDLDRFFLAYYEPFMRVLEIGEPVLEGDTSWDQDVEMVRLPLVGVTIGLHRSIAQHLRETSQGPREGFTQFLSSWGAEHWLESSALLYQDGSYFETSWQQSLDLDDVADEY